MSSPTYFYLAPRTPVVETSALPIGHKPLGAVLVDGRDVTRELAIFAVKIGREETERLPASVSAEDFVRQLLAAANHDLMCCGYSLISEDEIVSEDNPIERVAAPERVAALRDVILTSQQKFYRSLRPTGDSDD